MKKRTGILGGCFDPVHIGHIVVAEDAMRHFGLSEVLFVPCNKPSHKPASLASAEDRLAMLKRALSEKPEFKISDVDIRRGGITYSVDTVSDLARDPVAGELFFIIGSDSLPELHCWRAIDGLLDLCLFAVMIRPGFESDAVMGLAEFNPVRRNELLRYAFKGRQMNISSSDIRQRVVRGEGITHLVHPDVETYIAEHGLYGIT